MKAFPVKSVSVLSPQAGPTALSTALREAAMDNGNRLIVCEAHIVALVNESDDSMVATIVLIDGTKVVGELSDPVEV